VGALGSDEIKTINSVSYLTKTGQIEGKKGRHGTNSPKAGFHKR